MSAWLRWLTYTSFGVLWLSGCVWLALHVFFQSAGDFGPAPHPWQPSLMVIHGVAAMVVTFLVGWIAGSHVTVHWKRRIKRVSGIALISLVALLALTGLGGYYLGSESLRNQTAFVHELAGVIVLIPALLHWFAKRRGRAMDDVPN
jgi:hypothetical protein